MDRLLPLVAAALTAGFFLTTLIMRSVDIDGWLASLPFS